MQTGGIKREFFGNAAFSLFCALIIGIFAYLVRRTTANGLPGNEYAFFYSIFSLINIAIPIVSLGISNATFFALPDFRNQGMEEEARGAYAFCLRWVLVTGGALALVVFPLLLRLGNNIERYGIEDRNIFFFLLLIPLPLYISATMIHILNGLKLFFLSNSLLILNIASVLAGVFLFQKQYGLRALSVSYAAAALCVSGIGIWVCRKKYGYSITHPVSAAVRNRLLKTGIWLFLSGTGYYCFTELGNVILYYVGTPEDTMKFNIAMPVAVIIRSLSVVSRIFAPYSNELSHRHEYRSLRYVVLSVLAITLVMAACAWPFFSTFGKTLLVLLFGQRFVSASSSMLLLIICVFFWNAAYFFNDMLNSMHHEHISAVLSLASAILGGILYFVFSLKYGAEGAALGALITSVVWMVFSFFMILFLIGRMSKQDQSPPE